jgi:NHS family xanthosine MFS transporter
MNIKLRLTAVQFLQFFIWGSWLISLGSYMAAHGMRNEIGKVFASFGVVALITPTVAGILADRRINAERLLGILHLLGAGCLLAASMAKANFNVLYYSMLLNAVFFTPTIGLSYSVCYSIMDRYRLDTVKEFPPVRSWGTVGFIVAMWAVNLCGWVTDSMQFVLGSVTAVILGLYSFTLPAIRPQNTKKGGSLLETLGLDALVLLKEKRMAIFFLFAVLLGVCLQITNSFGGPFLRDFGADYKFGTLYSKSFAVQYNNIFMSFSQISEALFILAIPFFLRRFGIKTVMMMSLAAWVLRFGFFGLGNPNEGFVWLLLSMIIYGMAFDFFNISGSLFVAKETPSKYEASAQGMLMMATNGLGAVLGNLGAQQVINYYTVDKVIEWKSCFYPDYHRIEAITDWPSCWFIFAAYALVIGILFAVCFKYKHGQDKTNF